MNFKLKEIPNYTGYFAGSDGNIYSYWTRGKKSRVDYLQNPRKLKGGLTGKGYLHVTIKHNTRGLISKDIHRLICLSFYGESKLTASHKDGNKLNNKLANLKYETYSDNLKRKVKHGTDDRGFKNSRAKINKEQYTKIKALLSIGELTHQQIGKLFNVSRVFITKINCGFRYSMQNKT